MTFRWRVYAVGRAYTRLVSALWIGISATWILIGAAIALIKYPLA